MYAAPRLGIFLLACHILACLTVGLLFRFYKREGRPSGSQYKGQRLKRIKQELLSESKTSAGTLFGDAIRNSIGLILAIGGFIIIFSVIINLLLETGILGFIAQILSELIKPLGIGSGLIKAVLSGIFEITTGSSLTSAVAGIPLGLKLPAASLIIGWAGLSVHTQVLSITSGTDISVKPYLLGKLLQGIISAVYTWIGLKLLGDGLVRNESVLGLIYPTEYNWFTTMAASVLYLIYALAFITVLCIITTVILRIKKGRALNPPRF
jgi:sporulation integral membrane protein YlbJ